MKGYKSIGLVFLALFLGLSNGLQGGFQYKYKYFGTIATGIPELGSQAAGVGIRSDVIFQVSKDGSVIVKFTKVEVAEFNDELGCDLRGKIPTQFGPIKNEKLTKIIETPFLAHLFDHHDSTLVVEVNELQWVTNLRKGVLSVFHNEILQGNFEHPSNDKISKLIRDQHNIPEFQVMEETIFGKCEVEYTIHKLPVYLSAPKSRIYEQTMEKDCQRRPPPEPLTEKKSKKKTTKEAPKPSKTKTQGPPERLMMLSIADDLWHVVRSVNLDNCEDIVALQATPIGISGSLAGNQYEWLRSRSSVAEYILRGSGGAFRVERIVVEGSTTMAPFGLESGFLEARSNQTFQLVYACETSESDRMTLPEKAKEIKTWMQSVSSPYKVPQVNRDRKWITYTGLGPKLREFDIFGADPFTPEDFKALKETIVYFITSASKALADLDQEHYHKSGEIVGFLDLAKYHMKYLSKDDILEIFNNFYKKQVHPEDVLAAMLTIDLASASGTADGIRAILHAIKEEKVSYYKILNLAMTITSHLEDPSAIPDLMDFVMSQKLREKPFLGSTILVNFANLLHQLCVAPKAKQLHYPGQLFGDNSCKTSLIRNRFAPFLKEIIYNPNSHTWERQVAIVGLYELGSPFIIPAIREFIFGQINFKVSNEERSYAISTLDGFRLSEHASSHVRSEVMSMLREIFSNVGEDPGVRQVALGIFITWEPEAHFWHMLARTSWREPSKQMASYMTTLIETVAKTTHWNYEKQSQAATHALKFARPIAPSCKFSSVYLDSKRMAEKHVSMFQWFEWIKDEQDPERIDAYLLLMLNIGGFEFTSLELYFNSDMFTSSVLKAFEEVKSKKGQSKEEDGDEEDDDSNDIAVKVAKQYFEKILESVKAHPLPSRNSSDTTYFYRIFEHIQVYFPINLETISKLPFTDKTAMAQLFMQLTLGYDTNVVSYVTPINLHTFHASDLGLPVFASATLPMVTSQVALWKLGVDVKEFDMNKTMKKASLATEVLTKLLSTGVSTLLVYVPWSQSLVSTDVTSTREMTLPFNSGIKADEYGPNDQGHQRNFKINFETNYKKEFYILRASNKPSTSILPMVFLPNSRKPIIKEIVKPPLLEKHFDIPQTITGLHFKISWVSELPFPINRFTINDIMSDPSTFESNPLAFALASPTVKGWSLDVVHDPETSETKKVVIDITHGTCGKKTEEGQTSEEDTGQFSQGPEDYDVQQTFTQEVQQSGKNVFQTIDADLHGSAEIQTGGYKSLDIADTPSQRALKLQTIYGGPVQCTRIQFHYEGTRRRSYEISHSWTKTPISASRKIMKYQIAILRGPIPGRDPAPFKICLDVQKSMPKFNPLDTYESLEKSNLNTDVSAEVSIGCNGPAVFSVKGNYKLTDNAKKKLFEEVKQACDYDQYDPLLSFHRHAVYDEISYSIGWDKVCDMNKFPILTTSLDYLKKILAEAFQHEKCDTKEPSRKVTLNARRCPLSHHWYLQAKQDGYEISLDRPNVDEIFNSFFTVRRHSHASYKYPSHFTTHGEEATICSVGMKSVRTFDGYVYNYDISPCWSVAAKDCSHERGAILLVKTSQGGVIPDVRYIGENHEFIIDIENGKIRINGKVFRAVTDDPEEFKDSEGNVFAKVLQREGHSFFKLDDKIAFAYKDRIEISFPKSFQGKTCGMCGDYNGEPDAELVGPHRCYYEDPNTFVASWTAGSEACTAYDLIDKREKAEKYQKSCKKIDSILYKSSNYSHFCTMYGWKIKTLETNLACVSADPFPFCRENCIPFHESLKHVTFHCWSKSKAPAPLLDALAKGEEFLQSFLAAEDVTGQFSKVDVLTLPSSCRSLKLSEPFTLPPPKPGGPTKTGPTKTGPTKTQGPLTYDDLR